MHLDEILDRVIAYFTSDQARGSVSRGPARPPRLLSATSRKLAVALRRLRRGRRLHERRQPPAHPALHRRSSTPTDYGNLALLLLVRHAGQDRLPPGPRRRLLPRPLRPGHRRRAAAAGGHGGALRGRGRRACSSLLVVAGAGPLTRAAPRRREAPARAGWCWWRRTSSLGTFAFVPLSLLRIQDRPGLFSALLRRCATP